MQSVGHQLDTPPLNLDSELTKGQYKHKELIHDVVPNATELYSLFSCLVKVMGDDDDSSKL